MKQFPNISTQTFWDVNVSTIDFIEYKEWVINRVFDRGTLDEVYEIIKFYGFNQVKQQLQTTEDNLPKHAILLARAIFELNYSDFKCLEKKQFQKPY
ncbi:MAG: hypothetical protein K0B10_03400 [Vicingaceae bacterium]|nr:hypothetical protein [Vicingaceae bacterium]